ncbi:uncharacterized protein LOC129766743 [Toxorhynchites rutilus septentrionalis]|uniref:uncharacterized protein LOC129766743 n=1 Tax=Toxorhynchites rutilus septentrionalis TaxID=329112 RepID=UPI0024798971|nr:uncharacterized protein LOC129766743 [Toxorhynchites rutilus septentrionalis]
MNDVQRRETSPVNQSQQISCGCCGNPDDSRMVACDVCERWYHFVCVGVDASIQDRDWSCEKCLRAAAQIPTGTSTPTATGATAMSTNDGQPTSVRDIQMQLTEMQEKLNSQMKNFEKIMMEKDDQHRKALSDQRQIYERQLLTERRVHGPAEAIQRDLGSFCGEPTANSTRFRPSQSIANEDREARDLLSRELQLLEERQSLEKRHLEERRQLLLRFGVQDGNAADLNPQASGSQPINPSSLFCASTLSQSQISARQCISRELPTFSGNPEEWPLFIASYENSTRICGYSDEENLLRLQRSLKGKALEAVRCRLLYPTNLSGTIATLRTLFGRPEVIVHSLINKIREMPLPKAEKLQTLIDFGVAVQNVCATINASGLDEYLCNVALLHELVERLPPSIRLNWAYHRQTLERVTLSDLGDWLGKLVEAASVVTIPSMVVPKPERRGRRDDNYINIHSDVNPVEEHTPKTRAEGGSRDCFVCQGECSSLETCHEFLNMNIGSRWAIVKDWRLCRKCLRKHFGACHIRAPCGKNGCSFMHNKLLHDDHRYNDQAVEPSTSSGGRTTTQNCHIHSSMVGNILFRYAPVTLYGKGRTIKTFAFLDDGSSATFMEHSLMKELNLTGTSHPLCLNWTGGQQREENESIKLRVKISGNCDVSEVYELPKVHTVRSLALPKQSLSVVQLVAKYLYLKGLPLESYSNVSPRLLIGMDNCRLGRTIRSAEGTDDEPVASKTRLGWIVYGPCSMTSRPLKAGFSGVHSFHICQCNKEVDKELNVALKEYFMVDSLGITGSSKQILSKDEERALKILSDETRLKGNRYETGLLWRYDQVRLPDNKAMALKRNACLEKRLRREPALAMEMATKMSEYVTKGYIRRLTPAEKTKRLPNDWYLPIFPIVNPNKPGKMRIVFDAAAKVNGVSLNSFLLTGPDQLVSLLAVLHKFREFRIAVVGDIREMFFQVMMKPQDQRSQMILWRGERPIEDPDVYVVTVMTFGAACSPSSAHFIKNQNAERFADQYPRAVDCIKYEHYVDDMLASVETEEEALKLAKEVRFVHSQGGFEIRNWLSNSPKVTECIGERTEKNLNIEMATEKVLGMWWNTATDAFTFRISSKHDADLLSGARMPTKREVLRTLMAVYDPMGLIANYLMYLKILLQEIWRSGCDWDEQISGKHAEKWRVWIEVLPEVRKVSVPRCYRQITSSDASTEVQLHIFCDVSESGVAAVAYFRFQQNETIECAMVGSKTRVAPLKFLSIPRLELQAAVIGARMADGITRSHRIKISRRVFWTDSRDVVCWLRSDHRRYHQFVAFRISELLETTVVDEWRWLPTRANVADEGTKWQRLPDLQPTSRWFHGPTFLWKPDSEWPGDSGELGTTAEEIRSSVFHHHIISPLMCFERFTKWKRLLRTVAYVYRFITNLRKSVNRMPSKQRPLEQKELDRAEQIIYSQTQRQVYSDEFEILNNIAPGTQPWERILPKSSSLYTLCPTIDNFGVLRMQGRIAACEWVDESVKHPIILPRRNHVTDLVIAHYHDAYRHLNHQTVMNEIRLKYHIPRLRSEYNRVRKNCQHCKIRHAIPKYGKPSTCTLGGISTTIFIHRN